MLLHTSLYSLSGAQQTEKAREEGGTPVRSNPEWQGRRGKPPQGTMLTGPQVSNKTPQNTFKYKIF